MPKLHFDIPGSQKTGDNGSLVGAFRHHLFGLAPEEPTFERRGFRGIGEPAQARLERIGAHFLHGYHAALDDTSPEVLVPTLEAVEPELRGFAFEGAAMSLALLDCLAPWRRSRIQRFLKGGADHHVYMVYVGMGWAWARLRRRVEPLLTRLDPLLCWLTLDGFGFHEGFFHGPRFVERRESPRLTGYAARAFDQGLGRSLWFVEGAGVERIIGRLRQFPEPRQPDLWSGVGLACAYAGGVDRSSLERLKDAAGPCLPQMAQGVVFAAKARERAGIEAPHTALACEVVCRRSAPETAALADEAERQLEAGEHEQPRYEAWRRRIQQSV